MKTILTTLIASMIAMATYAEVIVITGVYQGKDVYIKNPVTTSGVGYCIFEVLVNGNITSDEVNSPAFAIDLAAWRFKIGDQIEIVLRCKEKCDVKIINPEVIYPNSTFEVTKITCNSLGQLHWETTKETTDIPYIIEQFKWNRWIKVGELMGQGRADKNSYDFQVKLHSGTNVFRVHQIDHKGQRTSQEVRVESPSASVSLKSFKITNTLEFSEETDYEIYSEYGTLVKSGRDKVVDTSKFFKGNYYVSFDNKGGQIVEKK